tara:strand:+ start:19 stop:267 length:249 start_codon:yes stop_codon:yes gene_type:complete
VARDTHNYLSIYLSIEVAARAMWWSMVAAYGEYKLQKRKIGTGDLKNMVWLAGTNEVLVFRDPKTDDAYVIFRGMTPSPTQT